MAQALATLLPLLHRAARARQHGAAVGCQRFSAVAGESHRADPANPRRPRCAGGAAARSGKTSRHARLAPSPRVDAPVHSLKTMLEEPALNAAFTALADGPVDIRQRGLDRRPLASLRAALRALAPARHGRGAAGERLRHHGRGGQGAGAAGAQPRQARRRAQSRWRSSSRRRRQSPRRRLIRPRRRAPRPCPHQPRRRAWRGDQGRAWQRDGRAAAVRPRRRHRAEVIGAFANPVEQRCARHRDLAAVAVAGAGPARRLGLARLLPRWRSARTSLADADPAAGARRRSVDRRRTRRRRAAERRAVGRRDRRRRPIPAPTSAGLMLDDWSRDRPHRTGDDGLAFHFDRPNAAPPQALLLAVPPTLAARGSGTISSRRRPTPSTARRLRAVEPDQLIGTRLLQVAADDARRVLDRRAVPVDVARRQRARPTFAVQPG